MLEEAHNSDLQEITQRLLFDHIGIEDYRIMDSRKDWRYDGDKGYTKRNERDERIKIEKRGRDKGGRKSNTGQWKGNHRGHFSMTKETFDGRKPERHETNIVINGPTRAVYDGEDFGSDGRQVARSRKERRNGARWTLRQAGTESQDMVNQQDHENYHGAKRGKRKQTQTDESHRRFEKMLNKLSAPVSR